MPRWKGIVAGPLTVAAVTLLPALALTATSVVATGNPAPVASLTGVGPRTVHPVFPSPAAAVPPAAAPAPPAPAPAAPAAAPAPAAPRVTAAPVSAFDAPHTDWVMVPSIGLSVGVGSYHDCLGRTPVPAGIASRDWCAPAATVYLLGHTPGVFAGIPNTHDGDLVRYWDGQGRAHTYRVTTVRRSTNLDYTEMYTVLPPHLVFQTCATLNGSLLWFVAAYPV